METITACRACSSTGLVEFLNLGDQPLSGVFPESITQEISAGPLRLMHCASCQLVQLGESYSHAEMYGVNYGYRSSLNSSMVAHLRNIASGLKRRVDLQAGDLICDIGSNDATFLDFFAGMDLFRVGVDPTIVKYESMYASDILQVPELFSDEAFLKVANKKAKLVTSIAMFYDLPDPVHFAKQIKNILDDSGVWFFEQSYAPWMQSSGAYDTICHEHLEYYSITSIRNILELAGMSILEVSTNASNGGSIAVTAVKSEQNPRLGEYAAWLLHNEDEMGANSIENWREFAKRVTIRKNSLNQLIDQITRSGKSIYGLGASTKGNVLLNYSEITSKLLPAIGEINTDKWGKFTPGSHIPIMDEKEIFELKPDYLLFLPWHFREFAIDKYSSYLHGGGKFIFPLPTVEVIGY